MENVTSNTLNINKYSFLFTLYIEYQYVLPALDLKQLCTKLTFKLISPSMTDNSYCKCVLAEKDITKAFINSTTFMHCQLQLKSELQHQMVCRPHHITAKSTKEKTKAGIY